MNKTIYALGFFDGVHKGHAALLHTCQAMARLLGCKAGVVTFETHPASLVSGKSLELINTVNDRKWMLWEKFHMDTVVTLPFDEQMRTMNWHAFLDMLCRDYNAAGFVCGKDFRFGYRGEGNPALLCWYCEDAMIPCNVVPEQEIDGIRVSSTYIRRQIETGDMATAVRFLGHPHILTGKVMPGKQLGRKMGIPTANMQLSPELIVPKFGVYACRVKLDGISYPAVTNIGVRPTVSGSGITVEPWILDYSGNLYNRTITLEFFHFLRPERKFDSLEELKQQIHADADQCRQVLKTYEDMF